MILNNPDNILTPAKIMARQMAILLIIGFLFIDSVRYERATKRDRKRNS